MITRPGRQKPSNATYMNRNKKQSKTIFRLFMVQQISQQAVVTGVANRMRWLCSFRQ